MARLWRGEEIRNGGEINRRVGKSNSYIWSVTDEKWALLELLDSDPIKAFERFSEISFNLISKIDEILYTLEEDENTSVYAFSKFLHSRGLFSCPNSFSVQAYRLCRNNSRLMGASTYTKYSLVVVMFEYFKKRLHETDTPGH